MDPVSPCEETTEQEWTDLRFEGRCFFYPGRDCKGWVYGGKCGRMGNRIDKEDDVPEDPVVSLPAEIVKGIVTEEMVTRACGVLYEEWYPPYSADASDFSVEDVKAGKLKKADNEAEEMNRAFVRRMLEAAMTFGQVISQERDIHVHQSSGQEPDGS